MGAGTPASEKRRLFWKFWLTTNFIFYLLLIVTVITVYRSHEQGQVLMVTFIVIIIVELILRIYIIFQLRSAVGLTCYEDFCILLYKEVNKMTVDKVNSISDMFSIAYLAVLCWSIYNGYSGIKSDPNTKKNFLISAGLVTIIALIKVFGLLYSACKICCGQKSVDPHPPPYNA
ncbi:17375_t:CDS:2 [Dentiscutata erythropus]|uniref:17375_t:CDS:1 n=1 Tax=Dentiscutata erythropus TaxID=1348616 RepID=A0A9N9FU28_9GLOM|nr:17375_t:CDS:2 [Dentiscutata erythropus]